jgi:hypothetical protein
VKLMVFLRDEREELIMFLEHCAERKLSSTIEKMVF